MKKLATALLASAMILGAASAQAAEIAVIVKTVDERTRAKTSINELLRD